VLKRCQRAQKKRPHKRPLKFDKGGNAQKMGTTEADEPGYSLRRTKVQVFFLSKRKILWIFPQE
jgi:hypothetical protein